MDLLALALLAQAWPSYHGGPENIKYSTLTQITPANVAQLKVAWRFDSGDEFEGSEQQCNPIIVNGVLYATTPKLRVVALDAATGAQKWVHDPNKPGAKPFKRRNRGVMYWRGQVLFGFEHWIIRLDAKTGQEVGRINLKEGLGRDPERLTVNATTPGVIYQDLLITGHLTSEDLPSSPGDIRAYDLKTGKIAWSFHTIPHPGELGHDTWPADSWKRLGGANNWAGMALDVKRGIVYVPTGSAAFDFYGANRAGDNLFANSLLALDAKTGKRRWHFQFVKHDVWDRDLPTAPSLVTVRRNGKPVDAVAQITKSGHVFLFNRETGESLFPLEEREVPKSDVDGEVTAAKQVLPLKPEPFARQRLTADMVPDPAMKEKLSKIRSDGQWIPPSLEGTIIFPGFDGGGEWGGASFDPETRLLYVNANEMPWVLRLVPRPKARGIALASEVYASQCAGCHRADRKGTPPEFPSLEKVTRPTADVEKLISTGAGRMPGYAQLGEDAIKGLTAWLKGGEDALVRNAAIGGLKFSTDGYNKFLDAQGYPGVAPPWGTLSAINLDTGDYAWKIPLGEFPELAAQGRKDTGTENYGGSIVTKSGLLFIAATNHDKKIRAFDKLTGKLLWEHTLPAAGNATPAMYQLNGKQYLVIGAGGGKSKAPTGGSYIAFALP